MNMFSACIIGTYHKPHLDGITVGVVGPASATSPLRAGSSRLADQHSTSGKSQRLPKPNTKTEGSLL